MKEFFAGRNAELLTKESEIPGIRVWSMEVEQPDLGHMSCRLQEAVTFIYILKGSLTCQVNQGEETLTEGEGLFVNRNNAWRLSACGGEGCRLYLAEIEAAYLGADELTEEKYVNPVMEDDSLFSLKLSGENGNMSPWAERFCALCLEAEKKEAGYELEMKSCVFSMWNRFFREFLTQKTLPTKAELREKEKLCRMLEFLHIHYNEKITLTEMAENSQVSTGEYCRFFKKRMGQTPFEYLQTCRIEKSIPEMLEKSESITRLAVKYGFTGSSYYAETFRKEMGCTPGEYRKWYTGELEINPALEAKTEKAQKKAEEKTEEKTAEPKTETVQETKTEERTEEKPEKAPRTISTRRSSMPAHLL